MATYYVDLVNGKDKPIATNAMVYNPYGTIVRVCYDTSLFDSTHDLETGEQVTLSSFSAYLNGTHTITVINNTQFDLDNVIWQPTTDYLGRVEPVNGTPDGLSWNNARRRRISNNLSIGDTIKIAKTQDAIETGVFATFTKGSGVIQISEPLTVDIDTCEGNTWTPAANVTCQSNYLTRLGSSSQRFNIGSSFTTGKIAYKQLPSTIDLSGFTKVSFNVLASNISTLKYYSVYRLCLCSDLNGDVVVNSLAIPPFGIANNFYPFVIDNGMPLGDSIKSIALYADADPGSLSLQLCNIFACENLNLNTIIGEAVNDFYCSVMSIVGNQIILEGGNANYSTREAHYPHDTVTTELLLRTGALLPANSVTGSMSLMYLVTTGASYEEEILKIIGGINKVTDVVDGVTIIDGQINLGAGLKIGGNTYAHYAETSDIWVCRCAVGITVGSPSNKFSNEKIFSNLIGSELTYLYPTNHGAYTLFHNIEMYCNANGDLILDNSNNIFINCKFYRPRQETNYRSVLLKSNAYFNYFKNCYFQGNTGASTAGYGLELNGSENKFVSCDFDNKVYYNSGFAGKNYFYDCNISVVNQTSLYSIGLGDSEVHYIPNAATGFNHLVKNGMSLYYQTEHKPDGASGAWCFLMGAVIYQRHWKVHHKIAEALVEGGKQVKVTIQVYKYNVGVFENYELFVCESVVLGLTQDIIKTFSVNNVWTEVELIFTPINSGIAEIHIGASKKSATGLQPVYFTNLNIVQI